MNRIVRTLVPAVLVAAGMISPTWAADLKVGIVNYGRLMQDSPQAKLALDAIRFIAVVSGERAHERSGCTRQRGITVGANAAIAGIANEKRWEAGARQPRRNDIGAAIGRGVVGDDDFEI